MVSQLLDHVEALEARISELEGRQNPPTEEVKERKPPSWVKACPVLDTGANRPDRPRKERKKRTRGFARRREEPTHRVEHATASCPDCGTLLLGGRVRRRRQIITLPQVRARTRVCKGFSGRRMGDDLQAGLGLWPGFGQQPDAAPESALEEQPPEPVDAVPDYAYGTARPAPGVAMYESWRLGWCAQVAWGDPAVVGVFHPPVVAGGRLWCRRPAATGW